MRPVSGYRYRPEILEQLDHHGIRPLPSTPPSAAYDLLKSIYTFEVRELNARRREAERILGPQPLENYRRQLHALLARYPVLKIPSQQWIEPVDER